jgi:hypothetical protein
VRAEMKTPVALSKKDALKQSGATYADVARLAKVSWTMVWMWMNEKRTSAKVEAAFRKLTGGGGK